VASIVALIAFARLARRVLQPAPALLATSLAALSPLLLYYSAEVKSYGLDWLAAVLLALTTLTVIEDASRRAWIRWGLAAGFCALVSTAAPFVVAAGAFALLAAPQVRASRDAALHLVAAAAPAAIIFGIQVLTVYQSPSTTSFMQMYWSEAFLEPGLQSGLVRAARMTREFLSAVLFGEALVESLPRKTMTVLAAVSVLGAFAIGRRSLPTAVLVLAPPLLAGLASFAKLWPLTPRLLLFAAPAVLLALPAGVEMVARFVPRKARVPVHALVAVVLGALAAMSVIRKPRDDDRFLLVSDALMDVRSRIGENATAYLSSDLEAPCIYYLRMHPARAALGGDPASDGCSLHGVRTVTGHWPTFVGVERGVATSGPRIVDPDWLDAEGGRILGQATGEVWVLIGSDTMNEALPSWLENAGAIREADGELGGIRILTYRPPGERSFRRP
jgi:hypothetical protein